MNCQDRRDLLLLYVNDALDAAEASEMRRHLQGGCPECAGYLAEAEAVMNSLPLGLDPVAPLPKLKEMLMRRIDADIARSPEAPEADREYPAPMRLFRYLIPAAIAAGIAIVMTHSFMMQKVNDLQQQASVLEQKADEAVSEAKQLEQLRGQFNKQTQVVAMLNSPGLKLIPLKATPAQPGATANLLWDQKSQQWAILTTGMTPAANGETYELWFITTKDAKIRAGIFDVDANGNGSLLVSIPPNIGDLKLAAVTNEKAGGVETPAGQIQVAGSVQ